MALSAHQIDRVTKALRSSARRIILPSFHARPASQSPPVDLNNLEHVTDADLQAEHYLVKSLTDIVPGSIVVGEEAAKKDAASVEALRQPQALIWTLDPIDGSGNFKNNDPRFGTMIACVINGVTEHAWLYCPKLHENSVVATRGEGAWFHGPDGMKQRIFLRDSPLKETGLNVFALTADHKQDKAIENKIKAALSEHVAGFYTEYSSAFPTFQTMNGGNRGMIYIRPDPWDCLPIALIMKEAGGAAFASDAPDIDLSQYRGAAPIVFLPRRPQAREMRALTTALAAKPRP